MNMTKAFRTLTLGISLATVGSAVSVSLVSEDAHAATRRAVCAQDLIVRNAPAGTFIGTLYGGQSIDVTKYSSDGVWAYGFAYGYTNKWGWVLAQYLCH